MVILIPSIGSRVSRIAPGKRGTTKLGAPKKSGYNHPGSEAIQVTTVKVSKGQEFPVVALSGRGHLPAPGADEQEAARVFYVAATRATQRLVMGVGGNGGFADRLGK